MLHRVFDFYTAMERDSYGVGCGHFGAKPNHPIVNTWLQMIEEFHGMTEEHFGIEKFLPRPLECWDYMWTNCPRFFSASVYMQNNKHGNNDAVFHEYILFLNRMDELMYEIKYKDKAKVQDMTDFDLKLEFLLVKEANNDKLYQEYRVKEPSGRQVSIWQPAISFDRYSFSWARRCVDPRALRIMNNINKNKQLAKLKKDLDDLRPCHTRQCELIHTVQLVDPKKRGNMFTNRSDYWDLGKYEQAYKDANYLGREIPLQMIAKEYKIV